MANLDEAIKLLREVQNEMGEILSKARINPDQIQLNALSDLSKNLGLLQAGEFRSPGEPGHGFTGIRLLPSGILTYNNDLITGRLESDGDFRLGSNTDVAGTTGLSVFSVAQTYNGELMGAGDILFGDNSSGKSNLFWDASAGNLYFRIGQITQAFLTNGAFSQVGAKVRRITTAQSLASGADAYISFDVEDYDDAGFFDAGQLTRVTIPANLGGVYQITFLLIGLQSAGVNSLSVLQIESSDGSSIMRDDRFTAVGMYATHSGARDCDLVAGEYLRMHIWNLDSITHTYNAVISVRRVR